jgi:hypothetical protein
MTVKIERSFVLQMCSTSHAEGGVQNIPKHFKRMAVQNEAVTTITQSKT